LPSGEGEGAGDCEGRSSSDSLAAYSDPLAEPSADMLDALDAELESERDPYRDVDRD
jgi:hypothetical protein